MKSENVKNENYVNLAGWMINDLGLKGNELIIYAIIYGFSQKKGQYFNGGYQYLADWTNSSKQTVINIMKSLEERGLIVRVETGNCSGKANSYYAVREVIKKNEQSKNLTSQKNIPDLVKKFDEGSQKTLPHNIDIINNNIYTHTEGESEDENQQPIVRDILKKYSELGLPAYQYKPKDYIIMECLQTLGAVNLFTALKLMSESEYVLRNMSINSIFKIENLKSALNGNFKNKIPVSKEKSKKIQQDKEYSVNKSYEKILDMIGGY